MRHPVCNKKVLHREELFLFPRMLIQETEGFSIQNMMTKYRATE